MFKVNEHAKALALCFFICFAYNVFICGESPIHKGSGHRLVSYITIYIFYNKNGQFSFMFFFNFHMIAEYLELMGLRMELSLTWVSILIPVLKLL